MTDGGWKAPSNHSCRTDLGITPQAPETLPDNGSRQMPAVFAGLDKAEALAHVSRLFNATQAGAALWGDKLLMKCSWTQIKDDVDENRRHLEHRL